MNTLKVQPWILHQTEFSVLKNTQKLGGGEEGLTSFIA